MMLFSSSSDSKIRRLARAVRNIGKENSAKNLTPNAPFAGRSVEHTWPSFLYSSTDVQLFSPTLTSSASSPTSPPHQTTVQRLSVICNNGPLADSTNVDKDSYLEYQYTDEEVSEFNMMYTTRFCGLKEPKLSRSALKKKLKIIRKSAAMKNSERFCTNNGVHGASHLRYTDVLHEEDIPNGSFFDMSKLEVKLRSVSRAHKSSLVATRRLMGKIKERLCKRSTSFRPVLPQNRSQESPPALDDTSARAVYKIIDDNHHNIDRFRLETHISRSNSASSVNSIAWPTIPDDSELSDILSEFPLPPTFEAWL